MAAVLLLGGAAVARATGGVVCTVAGVVVPMVPAAVEVLRPREPRLRFGTSANGVGWAESSATRRVDSSQSLTMRWTSAPPRIRLSTGSQVW